VSGTKARQIVLAARPQGMPRLTDLLGFARADRFNIYTGAGRIRLAAPELQRTQISEKQVPLSIV
jgi:hypothetical protein